MTKNFTGTKGNYQETNGTSNIILLCNEKKPRLDGNYGGLINGTGF